MEAIGTLAGGIAHDFNNILSAILGFSQIVLDSLPPDSTVYAEQQQIIKASLRAKDLVQHLLIFSRKQEHQKSAVIIGHVMTEAIQLLRASLPSTINFEITLNHKTGIILADATQIHQVIINICTNAAHAMEMNGGTLSVSLDKRQFSERDQDKPVEIPPGEYACIIVSDTGKGIDPLHLRRIYEPFFTTKPTGKGTGMGLAVVHGIVTSHGGAIDVQTVIGQGTTFRIYFPLINMEATTEPKPESIPSGNKEHILIVDDEEAIAMFTSTMLKRNGYITTAISDSREALKIFKQNPETFDLLITDQTMPAMTGFELAKAVLAIRSDIPILLCTGFSSVVSGEKALQAGISDFIMKPITKQVLFQKVELLLRKNQQNPKGSL
ncbi:response regulator [Desulfopila aestuarii]|uniref:histidine kinase n=1 Tax=Desulfopila aestuarii DSM 18488 TaxID=1121416 RepID=A0A1M7Y369_9BACT|nr:response regulator [Desulfopila aestuarii]SHO46594.1 His Kinase A (phospho-acceptor) domain-containing protein [Desulfopila aestuarii DSM 18488]